MKFGKIEIDESDYQLESWQCCCELVYQKNDGTWVFGIERTSYWDDDGYTEVDFYQEEYHIHYCPFCGKQLVQDDVEV